MVMSTNLLLAKTAPRNNDLLLAIFWKSRVRRGASGRSILQEDNATGWCQDENTNMPKYCWKSYYTYEDLLIGGLCHSSQHHPAHIGGSTLRKDSK